MSIVLNEYDWAEQALEKRELGKSPYETLSRIAKYYATNKYSKHEIVQLLEEFLLSCDPTISLSKWAETLNKAADNSIKYPPVQLDEICIYKNELAKIDALSGKQIKRLAFTLLCTAKYWDVAREANNHWVTSSDKEIMQMANISTSIKRQSLMYAQLRECELIRFSKMIDNLNVQVTFIDESGEAGLHIKDFRNLGYQYLQYCGEPYFQCANCGLTVKQQEPSKGRKQKYCPACAIEVHTRQKIESVMRHRKALKAESA